MADEGPKIDEALTRKIAHLSRLSLTDEEVHDFSEQLKDIFGYVNQLSEVDCEGVEPLASPLDIDTPTRPDEVRPSPRAESGEPKVLKDAPDVLYGGFKVPPIL
jgi:aspartyl-tRNA(Asn)/glutamyl-tRNA(Gln) amidotransferase subunit C